MKAGSSDKSIEDLYFHKIFKEKASTGITRLGLQCQTPALSKV